MRSWSTSNLYKKILSYKYRWSWVGPLPFNVMNFDLHRIELASLDMHAYVHVNHHTPQGASGGIGPNGQENDTTKYIFGIIWSLLESNGVADGHDGVINGIEMAGHVNTCREWDQFFIERVRSVVPLFFFHMLQCLLYHLFYTLHPKSLMHAWPYASNSCVYQVSSYTYYIHTIKIMAFLSYSFWLLAANSLRINIFLIFYFYLIIYYLTIIIF